VDHAGFLHSLAPGRRAAQAVHADGKEQGSCVGGDIQNITDDGVFFDFYSHNMTSYLVSSPIITATAEKNKRLFCLAKIYVFRRLSPPFAASV
jgi:hypothetical protein